VWPVDPSGAAFNIVIAEDAGLAPKTVEGVLGRVYAKLGVRSRIALATQVPGTGERDPTSEEC
jgi:hypothetical protein